MDPETGAAEFDLDMAESYRALAYYYENIDSMETWRERRFRESRSDHSRLESVSERV